jgi:hypothetical protein
MAWLWDFLAFTVGASIVAATLISVIRTFVLPRAASDWLTGKVFAVIRKLFDLRLKKTKDYAAIDRVWALYAPLSLMMLAPTWMTLVTTGFTFLFWAAGTKNWVEAFTLAGSSLLTLGFARGASLFDTVLSFSAATIGLILVALLIAYLPTMYSAFSRREVVGNQLAVLANTPPSPIEMLLRFHRLERLDQMGQYWVEWETWFVELEESHTSLAALVFFRSPLPEHSWVNAAEAMMDAAALRLALLDLPGDSEGDLLPGGTRVPTDTNAAIMLRAGFVALQRIADFFQVDYNPDPHFPEDQISIKQSEFEQAAAVFVGQGLPIKVDLARAWQDFAGWRVNYDSVLNALKQITVAPPTEWLGER